MTAVAIAAGIPAIPVVLAFALAIVKDGNPLRRSWWSS